MGQMRHEPGAIDRGRAGDGATVRLERDLAAARDEVWQLLTDPAELAGWLRAAVELEPRVGGAISIRFANTDTTVRGHVARFDPPALLELTWRWADEPESVVRFELLPGAEARSTRLRLTHARCDSAAVGETAAGWHHHLELLATQLAGGPVVWDWARFAELHAGYGTPAA